MPPPPPFATLPGPDPMPIVGWRGNLARFFRDPIGYMAPLPGAYGPLVAFARGGGGPVMTREATQGAVFAFGPACMQAVWGQMGVFHSACVPGPPSSLSFARLTSGLFSMNDDIHRQQRRLLQPAFHRARIEGYHATIVALTERAIEGWSSGETRDLADEMRLLTLAVANRTLFGFDATPGEISLGEQIQEVVERAMSAGARVPWNLPFTPRRRLIEAAARTEESLHALIARKRAAGGGSADVLATLLATRDEDGGALSEDELIGQLFLLFFAGHDTTRNAVAWTLFLLVQHPTILADLRDELRGELGGAPPGTEHIPRLTLLDRVIKESLRLLPPAPFTARFTAAPAELAGVELPAGTEVIISPYCLHRDPDLYPDAQRFRPGRWERLNPSPFEYAPFGAGPRMCIGAAFATLELKIVLSILLQRFGFDLPAGTKVDRKTTLVMSPRNGMPMVLRAPGAVAPSTPVRGNIREMVDLPS